MGNIFSGRRRRRRSNTPPVTATTPPVTATTPPVTATIPPVTATTPPVTATTPPVTATTPPVTATTPPPEIPPNGFVFAAATPYPNSLSLCFFQNIGYCPYPPGTAPPSDDHHHYFCYPPPHFHHYHQPHPWIAGGSCPPPYLEHQKAVTICNGVNLKKETLRLEPDPDNPGLLLVCFTFDANVSGRITVVFFAKEDGECNLTATKEDTLPPITVDIEKGLGQKFIQPSGTGVDPSVFEDSELFKVAQTDIYPLAIKMEAAPAVDSEEGKSGSANAQISRVTFAKEKGEIKTRVVEQLLWLNGKRYELQTIYGIGNTIYGRDDDATDTGKDCVICLSEPSDTAVLPCRHMCMCSGCAEVLRFQTNRCPICRQPVETLLEIQVNGNSNEGDGDGQS